MVHSVTPASIHRNTFIEQYANKEWENSKKVHLIESKDMQISPLLVFNKCFSFRIMQSAPAQQFFINPLLKIATTNLFIVDTL
ncbi:hypothetical protein, partial [Aeribacillus composti]|uniref:hypothetical protein n=1 Tax=Aeribacillus composti TaxID=1868734 RepID=UPI002E23AC18|nr:hypothetical protein [Aeribacillus composti]